MSLKLGSKLLGLKALSEMVYSYYQSYLQGVQDTYFIKDDLLFKFELLHSNFIFQQLF